FPSWNEKETNFLIEDCILLFDIFLFSFFFKWVLFFVKKTLGKIIFIMGKFLVFLKTKSFSFQVLLVFHERKFLRNFFIEDTHKERRKRNKT
ncbi:MAG: hypothetical protein COY74_03520, partial [Nitrosopumilales archaeon CG_4_10_14_0_8_um_filter_34_8]